MNHEELWCDVTDWIQNTVFNESGNGLPVQTQEKDLYTSWDTLHFFVLQLFSFIKILAMMTHNSVRKFTPFSSEGITVMLLN